MTSAALDRLQTQIRAAFADVPRPPDTQFTDATSGEEYDEASAFFGKTPSQLEHGHLVAYREVLFWFTPEAFHYFLPAFLLQAVAREDPHALYVDLILQLLMDPDDAFARARWRRLSEPQSVALRAWLQWLLEKEPPASSDHARAQWAIELLEQGAFRR